MRLSRFLFVLPLLLAAPAGLRAQGQTRDTSGVAAPRPLTPPRSSRLDSLPLGAPGAVAAPSALGPRPSAAPTGTEGRGPRATGAAMQAAASSLFPRDSVPALAPSVSGPFGRLAIDRPDGATLAQARGEVLRARRRAIEAEAWRRATIVGLGATPRQAVATAPQIRVPRPGEAAGAASGAPGGGPPIDIFGDYADLGLNMNAKLESKVERNKNERCLASQAFSIGSGCDARFQPQFDFQFNVKTGGVVADRIHLNVDYDSQREFDASNNISVYYQGKTDELLQRLEVGNVSFQPAPSRFITSGIPSGNYGLQAIGQVGPMRFRTILAQQKGNVVKDKVFTVGDRTLQGVDRDIEDYQVEPRRFFFTIDPSRLPGYPNLDILNARQLQSAALALPDSLRPTKLYVYRQTITGPQPNPNGPQFYLRKNGQLSANRQLFEYLREGIDYYVDPSNLWIALVRPVNLTNERLAIAYTTGSGQVVSAGGTPDLEAATDHQQVANLLWEPALSPTDDVFQREIRSVYRLGGEDVRRETVALRITSGSGGDQEKPLTGSAASYLQLFGLSQPGNPLVLDVDNHVWPRPSDPNYNRGAGGTNTKLIRDYFVVVPSLKPFARAGFAVAPNPANDTIYRTPDEYLYSSQRPATLYHLRAHYQAEGSGDVGTLALGSVQVRQNSERIAIGGVPLVRGTDYTVDYETGQLTFSRPDTLFPTVRQVAVRYEENPLFAAAPTSIFGMAAEFPMTNGQLNFTAISQAQKTTFNRPPLGFEPASSFVAGVNGNFVFDAAPLSRAIERLPFNETTAPSSIGITGEIATSRPQPNSVGRAWVESFEGEGATTVPLVDNAWYYASRPLSSPAIDRLAPGTQLDTAHAATLVWQTNGALLNPSTQSAQLATFTFAQIDTLVKLVGNAPQSPEQLLWMTLFPLSAGGITRPRDFRLVPTWTVDDAPVGRRWRSIRAGLGAQGIDLSRTETLEFWVLVSTEQSRLAKNPVLAFDFGDISENSLVFAPDTMRIATDPVHAGFIDTTYTGKRVVGLDTLDTERNPLTRSWDAGQDDRGLRGDVVRGLTVIDAVHGGGLPIADTGARALCRGDLQIHTIGDTQANCTVANSRLDEEDLDQDFQLNLTSAQAGQESFYRYVVDLSDPRNFSRYGGKAVPSATGDTVGGVVVTEQKQWVLVRLPFHFPTDSQGTPNARRIRALRLTMISGLGVRDQEYNTISMARLRLVGSPWLKRGETLQQGIAGEGGTGAGFVIAGVVGTQDREGLGYESPPGVTDQTDTKQTGLETQQVQINERSLRLTAGIAANVHKLDRAEAYYRFPEGQKNFMGYTQLKVWARGRGAGWGQGGELQFYVKVGRDANNFYLYRSDVSSGEGTAAWLPEVTVDFSRFFALRAKVQNAYLQGGKRNTCTGTDSALVARSQLPAGATDSSVYAACDGNYMIYTVDPAIAPPNLAGVQELAVGMVRVDSAGGPRPLAPADTLELWVDDIRLTGVVATPGYAGSFGLDVVAGDLATVRLDVSRRDPNFRQLTEQPSFRLDNQVNLVSSLRLDKLLPQGVGLSLPLTVSYSANASTPTFLNNTDLSGTSIEGLRTPENASTHVSLGMRRSIPVRGPLAPLLNNLGLNADYNTGGARTEYSRGASNSFSVAADWRLLSQERLAKIPGWFDRVLTLLPGFIENSEPVHALRTTAVRWNPTQLSFQSQFGGTRDRTHTYFKPAATSTDTASISENLTRLWRNTGAFELRPYTSLSLRWNVASLRDLRHYYDSTLTGNASGTGVSSALVATGERNRLFGMDVGLERERQMSSGLSWQPIVSPWIRPRAELSSSYTFFRNPTDLSVLRTADSSGAFRLPRRFGNSQNLNLGATMDLARLVAGHTTEGGRLRRLGEAFQPLDLSWNRSLTSAYDGVPFSPGLGYQFATGGIDQFRRTAGRAASSAGLTRALSGATRVQLPLGTSLGSRFQRTNTTSWARRADGTQGSVNGVTTSWPDATLSWNLHPQLFARFLNTIGANAGYQRQTQLTLTPAQDGSAEDRTQSISTRYPVSLSVAWQLLGGLTTNGSYARGEREERAPGNRTSSPTTDAGFDVAKGFKLPASWNVKSDLRTRLGFQQSHNQAFQLDALNSAVRSRRADNGRRAINFNADTDLAQNMTGSLTVSRVETFDNTLSRRFTQTLVSAVLNIQFFAGELH